MCWINVIIIIRAIDDFLSSLVLYLLNLNKC